MRLLTWRGRSTCARFRRSTGMTQAEFAAAYFSVRTVQEWERGAKRPSGTARTLLRAIVTERLYRADTSQDAILANSPIKSAYEGSPFRSRLTAPAAEREFPILTELRRTGMTDYVVLPVPFSDGTNKALSLAGRRILRRRAHLVHGDDARRRARCGALTIHSLWAGAAAR